MWIQNGILMKKWDYWSIQNNCMTLRGRCGRNRACICVWTRLFFWSLSTIKVMIQWFCEMLWNTKIKGAVDTKNIMISSIFWSDVIIFVHFQFHYSFELSEFSHQLPFCIITISNSFNQPICLDKNYMHGCPYS